MKKILPFAIWFLLSSVAYQAVAQKILFLERPGTTKYRQYEVGDLITFQSHDTKFKGHIIQINDSSFRIDKERLHQLSDIQYVIANKNGWKTGGKILASLGVLYLGVSALNGVIAPDEPQVVSKNEAITSASLVGAGGLLHLVPNRKFKMGKSWRLRVIDFTNDIPRDDKK